MTDLPSVGLKSMAATMQQWKMFSIFLENISKI